MPARIVLLAVALALVCATPASAAVECKRSATGAPVTARVTVKYGQDQQDGERSALVLCDRRSGRARVLRRLLRKTGRRMVAASAAGRRVAWLEGIVGRRRSAFVIVVADGRTGRPLTRRYIQDSAPYEMFDYAGVALTTRGELAWTVGRRRTDLRVVYAPPGAAPRELARGQIGGMGVEDDGTLLWSRAAFPGARYELVSYDLPGRDFGLGCPKRRSRYFPTLDFGGVVFTEARYGSSMVLRACDRATGRDSIVANASSGEDENESLVAHGAGNGWVAVSLTETNRYDQCGLVTLRTVEIATRRVGRVAVGSGCASGSIGRTPFPVGVVVTAAGAPAFVQGDQLVSVSAEQEHGRNTLVVLDEGDIRDLAADGDEVVWTNAGQPRRARP